MRITNANLLINGRFVSGGIAFDEKITAIGSAISDGIDVKGCYVIPGLIDIHSHGAQGIDCCDANADQLSVLARHYAAQGVTSWCPTTMTLGETALTQAMKSIAQFVRPIDGAKIAGIHLEGPFLSRSKRGAQNPQHLQAPDIALFHRLNAASGGLVRLVTVAPELPGALAFIAEASRVCTVSLGHTAADYDTATAAYAAGASHTTHLFNGMTALHHRTPGVIAAAWDSGATAELICDGLHVHPAVVRMAHKLFGERWVLVSDSLPCTGLADGAYTLGGQSVALQNGKATLPGTDTLAGSTLHLMDALRRSVQFGIPLEGAVTAATLTAAKVIRLECEIGSLEVGKWADLVVLDKSLAIKSVFIDGKRLF